MTLSNHVTISITQDSAGIARAGFGVPMILSHAAAWAERVRTYTDLSGVAADFATTTSPEYLAAQAIFAQNPHPSKIKIGRCALDHTMKIELTPTAANLTAYTVTVGGEGVTTTEVTYTSDATATVAEICAGLELLISAVTGNNYAVVDNTTSLTITGDAAGDWFYVGVHNPALIQNEMTHVDAGIATDLAAIALEDNDWYCLLTHYNSNAVVLAADAWIQTQSKIYLPDVSETEAATTTVGNSDTLDDMATLNRERTGGIYHWNAGEMFAAAWAGKNLPNDPGSISWKFWTLSGVTVKKLTSTQRANLVARSANFYETVAGDEDMTSEGTTADGDWIDVQRGLDWIEDDMSKGVFGVLKGAKKVPFTDAGVAMLEKEMKATLKRAVTMGILAASPAPTVTVPAVADVSAVNKTNRTVPDMKFTATLAGAVHKATLTGIVSV